MNEQIRRYWKRWRNKAPAGNKLVRGAETVTVPGKIARKMAVSQDRRRTGRYRVRGWRRAGTRKPRSRIETKPFSGRIRESMAMAMRIFGGMRGLSKSQLMEVRSEKSEVRSQKSEVRRRDDRQGGGG